MNGKVNLIISFAEMLQKIVDETKETDYSQTFDVAVKALSSEEGSTTIFDVAYALHLCDVDKAMPGSVLEYLKTVYQIGIDEGNPICMNNMGSLYYTVRCGMKDYKIAKKYYEMSVKTGYPLSAENLGYIYYYGLDTDIDYEKAYKFFAMAALQGRVEATYKIGDMFRYGYYVDKSHNVACILYHRALEMSENDKDCTSVGNIMKRMGDLYYEGIGCDKDPKTALIYYQAAEVNFYRQIEAGDPYVKDDLEFAVKAQTKIRKQIIRNLPSVKL